MIRLSIAFFALTLVAGCVPPGIPGENGRAYFQTGSLCVAVCDDLPRFAAGGSYSVVVRLDSSSSCGGADFSVEGSGVAEDVSSEPGTFGCSWVTTFSAPRAGTATFEVLQTGDTEPIDYLSLYVVDADDVRFRHETIAPWSPLDFDHVVMPVGAYLDVSPSVFGAGEPLLYDPTRVDFAFEGTVSEDPNEDVNAFASGPDHVVVSATEIGSGTVRAQVGDVTGTLSIEVVSPDAIDSSRWCDLEEHCDGLDNDCDGAVDETGGDGCILPFISSATCDAGRCTNIECFGSHGDCDDRPGCETDSLERCGALRRVRNRLRRRRGLHGRSLRSSLKLKARAARSRAVLTWPRRRGGPRPPSPRLHER